MKREKPFLYIDTNFSLSDQLMLKLAFSSDDFEIVGISTISSSMSEKMAAENIVGMSEREELFLPVAPGEKNNLLEQKILLKGEDQEIFKNEIDYPEEDEACDKLYDIASNCGKIDILATGPLTNIAKALRKYEDLKHYISHIFILGGTFSFGDVTDDAEFNFFTDPIAADEVLNSGIEIFLLPLEISKSLVLKDDFLRDIRKDGNILQTILNEYKILDEDKRELKSLVLYYLLNKPQAFIFEEESLKVEKKIARGKVTKADGKNKVYIANRVNENGFFDFLKENL